MTTIFSSKQHCEKQGQLEERQDKTIFLTKKGKSEQVILPSVIQLTPVLRQSFPPHPSKWTQTSLENLPQQPRLVNQLFLEQPRQTPRQAEELRKKLKLRRFQSLQQFRANSYAVFGNIGKVSKLTIILRQRDTLKWERLQDLTKKLSATCDQDRLDAAKALWNLKCINKFVVSALHAALVEEQNCAVRYEIARALLSLGSWKKEVVMELIKYVRKDTQIQDDVISNFEDALKRWSMTTRRLRPALSAVSNMVEAFTQIVTTPHADPRIPMKAATCLCYLDSTDQIGIDKLFTYLHDKDSYTKKHALEILAKHLKMYDQVIIQATIDLLCTAPVYKHRLVALETLINIGLEGINENNMTEQIFQTLREKLWNEPHLVVRQRVAMTVNYLRMKRKMWEVVEKQLGHKDEENRSQAVISLGVLGVGSTRMLRTLLEMTEIDPSDQVQFQIIRTFARLHLNDIRVKRNLCNRQQRAGPLGREASKALKNFVNLPCEPKQSVSTLM
eukprot:gi/632943464/ref/XP_007886962.1/ PREDICTED: uncharacterized protein C17orf66 homolog isoform X2 [Callorhinchus milii]